MHLLPVPMCFFDFTEGQQQFINRHFFTWGQQRLLLKCFRVTHPVSDPK